MTTTQTADVTLRDPLPVAGTRLVVLMYDGCIGALHKALDAIASGDAEARCRAILMATDILAQLCDSLDMEKGGQIAENLDKLYRFMRRRLPRVNLLNDPVPARDVLRIIEPLYDSWRQLDEKLSAAAAAESADARPEMTRIPARAAG